MPPDHSAIAISLTVSILKGSNKSLPNHTFASQPARLRLRTTGGAFNMMQPTGLRAQGSLQPSALSLQPSTFSLQPSALSRSSMYTSARA